MFLPELCLICWLHSQSGHRRGQLRHLVYFRCHFLIFNWFPYLWHPRDLRAAFLGLVLDLRQRAGPQWQSGLPDWVPSSLGLPAGRRSYQRILRRLCARGRARPREMHRLPRRNPRRLFLRAESKLPTVTFLRVHLRAVEHSRRFRICLFVGILIRAKHQTN